jgi:hypothetical protein
MVRRLGNRLSELVSPSSPSTVAKNIMGLPQNRFADNLCDGGHCPMSFQFGYMKCFYF